MSRPLRIAVTVDPIIAVPPTFYGGIERIVDMLLRGLAERGHELTVLAHPLSRVPGTLVPYGAPPHHGAVPRARELWQVGSELWRRRRQLDLVHSFGRLRALIPIIPRRSLPKIQSYQRPGAPWGSVRIATRLGGDSMCFTGCSTSVYRGHEQQGRYGGEWHTIFNGVDLAKYRFVPTVPPDAPLVFLGRIERIKGAHDAIAIARRAGRKLVIAGNCPDQAYFDTEIAPHLGNERVEFIGPVDDARKNEVLGQAAALLFPIDIEEAFGIVVAEANACGTPVVGYPRGAVPEIIESGRTGFVSRSVDEAVQAVAQLDTIDRGVVRRHCETHFSSTVIVDQYEQLYQTMVARVRDRGRAGAQQSSGRARMVAR